MLTSVPRVGGSHQPYIDPVPVHNASLGELYTDWVNTTTEFIYEFSYSQAMLGERALRV